MAISHVIKLFSAIDLDEALRYELYNCFDQDELVSYLNSKGYYFNSDDIDNAFNFLHVQCQTLEDAQTLHIKADWLRFLISGS
jgi:hypothetical protein